MYLGTHFDAPFRTSIQIETALDPFRDGKLHIYRSLIRRISSRLDIEDDELAVSALEFYLTSEGMIRINAKGETTVF